MNHGTNSDVNLNMYRDTKNTTQEHSQYKRNKSSRSNNSNPRKKKKLYTSMAHTVDKRNNLDQNNQNEWANQLISLIQKMHSPNSGK